jgi:hypothetical protein
VKAERHGWKLDPLVLVTDRGMTSQENLHLMRQGGATASWRSGCGPDLPLTRPAPGQPGSPHSASIRSQHRRRPHACRPRVQACSARATRTCGSVPRSRAVIYRFTVFESQPARLRSLRLGSVIRLRGVPSSPRRTWISASLVKFVAATPPLDPLKRTIRGHWDFRCPPDRSLGARQPGLLCLLTRLRPVHRDRALPVAQTRTRRLPR